MTGTVWSLILALGVIGLVVFGVAGKSNSLYFESRNAQRCSMSLSRMEDAALLDSFPGEYEPDCKKDFIKVKRPRKKEDIDYLKLQLAEAVRKCWTKTGGCQPDPYVNNAFSTGWYCMICSEIQFEKYIPDKMKVTEISDVYNYMKSKSPQISDKSYFHYMSAPEGCNEDNFLEFDDWESIDTNQTYFLMWKYDNAYSFFNKGPRVFFRLVSQDNFEAENLECRGEIYQ